MMDYCHHTCDSIKTTWFASPMNMCKFILFTIVMFHVMKCMSFSCKKFICKSYKTYNFNDLTISQYLVCKVKTHGPTLRSYNQGTQTLTTWDFLMFARGVKNQQTQIYNDEALEHCITKERLELCILKSLQPTSLFQILQKFHHKGDGF